MKVFGKEVSGNIGLAGIIIVLLIPVLVYIGFLINHNNTGIIIEKGGKGLQEHGQAEGLSTSKPTQAPEVGPDIVQEEIKVHVAGCVKKPGVVTLEKGQLIGDAIQAAGGFTEEADVENVNLVYALNENVMLKIKPKAGNPVANQTGQEAKGIEVVQDAGKAVEIVAGAGSGVGNGKDSGSGQKGKININTATAEELDAGLPGVGEKIAQDIIAFRKKNGKFFSIQDIMKVPGIGESKFNRMKELISVE